MVAWIQLQSSAISAVAYQGTSLFVRFINNHEYEYYNVPKNIYDGLISAPSAGRYFNAYIEGRYNYRQIS